MLPHNNPSESAASSRWHIKTRWLDITGLGRDAEILLRAIREEAYEGHISPRYLEPPKWRFGLLYELLKGRLSQDGLLRGAAELHKKGILCLAYTYTFPSRFNVFTAIMPLYRNPEALHAAVRKRYGKMAADDIDIGPIEIYLVLPEDNTVIP